jgi:excinuclease ABC subunit B
LQCPFAPAGDQPKAIDLLTTGLQKGTKHQTLLGITGSGKTFTLANVVRNVNRPTLILAPNKTLAAQLFNEFHLLFPENAVEYFISYFDYYQPEAYLPTSDTYIEKDSAINEQIDKLRHQATLSVLTRRDVIVVASVSAIYGIGSPENYGKLKLDLAPGNPWTPDQVSHRLASMQYRRIVEEELERGTYRILGQRVDVFPSYGDLEAVRISFQDGKITALNSIDPSTGFPYQPLESVLLFPATHYVTNTEDLPRAIHDIKQELKARLADLYACGKTLEAQRLEQRTVQDMEMLHRLGFCKGIENYSRHLEGRAAGLPPATLLDYFPKDFLMIIDESHLTVPQIRGMYQGDRSRKQTLVEFGFRLPSALDNRPLNYDEFEARIPQVIYVSATPGPLELQKSYPHLVEQIIRPTGLLDPEIQVFPASEQVKHLLANLKPVLDKNHRVLVLTLTKKMAEQFSEFLRDARVPAAYLHSDIKTLDRTQILDQFRKGDIHILVGINLLREGIDLPEVELVAVLDADKEGYLRSETSLIQMMGRASRNVEGKVFVYADRMTQALKAAIRETQRRRTLQTEYNQVHGIVPQTVQRSTENVLEQRLMAISLGDEDFHHTETGESLTYQVEFSEEELKHKQKLINKIKQLRKQMKAAAQNLEFEKAQALKDAVKKAEQILMFET